MPRNRLKSVSRDLPTETMKPLPSLKTSKSLSLEQLEKERTTYRQFHCMYRCTSHSLGIEKLDVLEKGVEVNPQIDTSGYTEESLRSYVISQHVSLTLDEMDSNDIDSAGFKKEGVEKNYYWENALDDPSDDAKIDELVNKIRADITQYIPQKYLKKAL